MARKRNRRSPTELEKRAATALIARADDGRFILDRKACKGMAPREILREFDRRVIYAHGAADATGGSMHPTNLWPTRRDIDARETPRDISRIAKGKRLAREHQAHMAVMAAKAGQVAGRLIAIDVRGDKADGPATARREPPKRPWPSRTIPSRPFPKRRPRA